MVILSYLFERGKCNANMRMHANYTNATLKFQSFPAVLYYSSVYSYY